MEREKLGSRIGFILLSAGCAIGVGNVWKFPWLVGENGGGIFIIFYVLFLLILGLPVMNMEFAVGRAAQCSPIMMHEKLVPKNKIWKVHSYMCLLGCIILMMFYTMVTGWFLYYFVHMAKGDFVGLDTESITNAFSNLCSNPKTLIIYSTLICILGFFVLSFSLKGGLERVSKYLMSILFLLIIVMAIRSFTLSGVKDGLTFYLKPDFSKINKNMIVAAMNQAFFTLSIGIGALAIFGSYISKDKALTGESIIVIILDTFVAFMSGLIIFPTCFTYGVKPDAGPSLVFITLPNIFVHMNFGRVWGSLFFLFLSFAAFTTVIAVFECILSSIKDLIGVNDRKKLSLICCICMIFLSIPCCLGFNVLSNIQPLGEGTNIMDLEDFAVSNLLLPLGSIMFVLFCTLKSGWGWNNFMNEVNEGNGIKMPKWTYTYCKFVLPVIIIVLLILGLIK